MADIKSGQPVVDGAAAGNYPGAFRITPETYTTIDSLIKTTKDHVLPDLVETYGDQGITGFLKLTGAINSGGTSDQFDWWEVGRRHSTLAYSGVSISGGDTSATIATAAVKNGVQVSDVVMDKDSGRRFIVQAGGTEEDGGTANVILVRLDGDDLEASDLGSSGELIKLGNMFAQGTNQPIAYDDIGVRKYSNSYMIVKGRYEVNGSQATNIGWVNVGGGEYRWFMKGEQEARAKFEDQREMMLLFGEKHDSSNGLALADDIAGSEGYFSAIEERGIVVQNANTNPMDSFAEFDDLIMELDRQGAPSEYAMYLNRKQDLAIDDMLASGIATGVSAGLPGQFGAFQNDADMAVKLGFKSFTRGGYTFHKHDWKLLNDPTLLADSDFIGVGVPMAQVADAKTGEKAPALEMNFKQTNGYSREMEHWMVGSILGASNATKDNVEFHYRSECNLITRAANRHMLIKG